MAGFDPSELIAVCDSILEDGEISGTELYRLAEWLNENRKACYHWPGDLLVQPLQEAWADGKVTKMEMRQIGRLLVRIRKEWTKRQAEVAFENASDTASLASEGLDLSQPLVPHISYTLRVKSHSDKSVIYNVDLSGPSCSCPDWVSKRSGLDQGHLGRCCKHVLDAYSQIGPDGGWPAWLGAFIDSSWPPHPQQEWMVLRIGQGFALASTAPTGWANVFALEGGEDDRFGYNVIEDRWSYGTEPAGSSQIRAAILNSCATSTTPSR